MEARLGKYSIDSCRIDLIPSVALERLGLHNELCALKWKDPAGWQRDGEPSIGTAAKLERLTSWSRLLPRA